MTFLRTPPAAADSLPATSIHTGGGGGGGSGARGGPQPGPERSGGARPGSARPGGAPGAVVGRAGGRKAAFPAAHVKTRELSAVGNALPLSGRPGWRLSLLTLAGNFGGFGLPRFFLSLSVGVSGSSTARLPPPSLLRKESFHSFKSSVLGGFGFVLFSFSLIGLGFYYCCCWLVALGFRCVRGGSPRRLAVPVPLAGGGRGKSHASESSLPPAAAVKILLSSRFLWPN